MDWRLLLIYFVLGGATVAAISYFGAQGKGPIAAFLALLPSISVVTLVAIHLQGGANASLSYARNMLFLFPAWVLYIVAIVLLLPRIGIAGSLLIGIPLYVVSAYAIIKFL
ncbi:MAG: DUF3147 domain-containing protein [Chloroflexi bacterium]|nr:DUF3147 domain-containing protein [Chloroflexota bacterium]